MKYVYIFFGEMGCGKSYQGSRFAKRHDFKFFEGDSVVTPEMMEKVVNFKPIPLQMLHDYMDNLGDAIMEQLKNTNYLVVSQAFYRDEHRVALKNLLEGLGCEVRMWLVKCKWHRNIANLLTRPKGWHWVYYWLINKPFFQKPSHEYQVFYNIYYDTV